MIRFNFISLFDRTDAATTVAVVRIVGFGSVRPPPSLSLFLADDRSTGMKRPSSSPLIKRPSHSMDGRKEGESLGLVSLRYCVDHDRTEVQNTAVSPHLPLFLPSHQTPSFLLSLITALFPKYIFTLSEKFAAF